MPLFKITRTNGRSNAEVLAAVVAASEPGRILSYDELAGILGEGTDRAWKRVDVQQAVNGGRRYVLRQTRRDLVSLRGTGYQVSRASEHVAISKRRERKAGNQMARAVEVLQNTPIGELSSAQAMEHDAHLAVTAIIAQQVMRLTRKQHQQDDLISNLNRRVTKLEEKP